VAIATTNVTVASLTLPAGSYLLYAKANLVRTGGSGSNECSLRDGATALDTVANQGNATGEVIVAHAAITLSATTTVTYQCRVTAGTANASNRTFSAVRFTALTVQ
jgi:hypothetical protein